MTVKIDDRKKTKISQDQESDEIPAIPENLPLLPLRDVVLFPNMVVPILVAREASIEALQAALVLDRYIFLVLQKNPEVEIPGEEDLYNVGVIGRALQVLKLPNGTAKVLIEGLETATLNSLKKIDKYFSVNVIITNKDVSDSQRNKALTRSVLNSFSTYVKLSKTIPDEVLMNISTIESPQRLADTISAHLIVKQEIKQKILETATLEEQLNFIASTITEEIEILKIEHSIDREVKGRLQKSQKNYYLHEQMRVIKEELGEEEGAGSEINELKLKIKRSGMPKEASKKAMEELDKLKRMHSMSPESTVVRNYLDWLISLPWKKRTRDNLDIKKAKAILDADHYGLEKPKERILEYLAVLKMTKKNKGPILCFSGPPGTGKTSLGRSVAHALGKKFVRMSLGGIRDEAEIRGHRRTYIGSLPGRIIHHGGRFNQSGRLPAGSKRIRPKKVKSFRDNAGGTKAERRRKENARRANSGCSEKQAELRPFLQASSTIMFILIRKLR